MYLGLSFAVFVTACLALAGDRPTVGLLVEFPDETSPMVRSWFHRETERVLGTAGMLVVLRNYRDALNYEPFERMVIIEIGGKCLLPRTLEWRDGAPMGMTHITDGEVLPFVELDCQRVLLALGQGGCEARHTLPETVLGRALARVAAHEIVHVLTGSTRHDSYGLMKPSFSRHELCDPVARFSEETMQRLRSSVGIAAGEKPPS
jgi:hypothetical protein